VPQSLSNILVHVIFSTKGREGFLREKDLRVRTHAYLAATLRDRKCPALLVGGVADHVHLLVRLSKTVTVAELVEQAKIFSSRWLKTQGRPSFAWQRGYGSFSIGHAQLGSVLEYIEHQEEHHKRATFQEEFRSFLRRYHMFDERYVWD
jgi:putative transposase